MLRSLNAIIRVLGIAAILLVTSSALLINAQITASPLYLSVPLRFTVLNVINISSVLIPIYSGNISAATQGTLLFTNITIIVKNLSTGVIENSSVLKVPFSMYKYAYYSTALKSVFFLINVTADKPYTISLYSLEQILGTNLGIVYTIYNTTTTTITIIPAGWLQLANNGQTFNTTKEFNTYLNGYQGVLYTVTHYDEVLYGINVVL